MTHSSDFIDVEPSNGNVWKMLLGAIDDRFDTDDPLETEADSQRGIKKDDTGLISSIQVDNWM